MTIAPRPKTRAITTNVPEHLVEAFLHVAQEFFVQSRGGQTSGQRAAEIRAQDRDCGMDSLAHLLTIAEESETHQAGVVARFLAGLYNGQDYRFDLTELRRLDDDLLEHCLAVLRLVQSGVEVHQYFPDGERRWQLMIAAWSRDDRPV
jgi:hypothetical protein